MLPGAEFFLDYASRVEISDNYDRLRDPQGTSALWLNDFALTYDSITRNQRLTASAGFTYELGYRADALDNDDGNVTSPFAELGYEIQNRSNAVDFRIRYAERDNGFDEIDITDADDIIVDQGTRSDFTVEAGVLLGRDAPLTFGADVQYIETRFFDTTDPGLVDENIYAVESFLSFNLTRTTSLFIRGTYREEDEFGTTDRFEVNTDTSLGLSFALASGLEGAVTFGYAVDEVEETFNGQRVETRTDSPVVGIDLSAPRPNGVARANLSQEVNEEGRRTSLTVGREIRFRGGGFLDADLGLSYADYDENIRGIGSIRYVQDLPRGSLQLRFSQQITDDSDEDGDVFISTAGLDWTRPLTNVSSLGLTIDLSASEGVDADEADTQRASLLLSYRRNLTEEWDFNAGYRHSTFRETGLSPIIENAVFAGIARRFDVRP